MSAKFCGKRVKRKRQRISKSNCDTAGTICFFDDAPGSKLEKLPIRGKEKSN